MNEWWIYLKVFFVIVFGFVFSMFIVKYFGRKAIKNYKTGIESAQEAQRIAFLGTLASGFAHEVRNPLATLVINLQLLGEEWRNPITERERIAYKKIEVILKEVRELERIFNDFIRFARGYKLNPERSDINQIIIEVLSSINGYPNIRYHKNLADALPPISIDRYLVKHAIYNIIKNAQEAIGENGGDITLKTTRDKRDVVIEVSDTGCGIPQENKDKLFNMFFTTKKDNTGLGLSTAKKIIEAHSGLIEFESTLGKGSTFRLRLPIRLT
jgi:signal transduction histidine kinase